MDCIFAANLAGEKSRLQGMPSVGLENVVLLVEGLEALCLADMEEGIIKHNFECLFFNVGLGKRITS